MRLQALKSSQCASKKAKYQCPEIFLDVVAEQLVSTAVLFLNVELLAAFYHDFPRELDARLGRHLADAEVERFAREDPKVRRHLDVIRRKEMLELVLAKMEGLRLLEGRERRREGLGGKLAGGVGGGGKIGGGGGGGQERGGGKGWRLF